MLASIAWAIRTSYHSTKEATPAQPVFGRDMILNMAYMADWKNLANKRQQQINKDNLRENAKRVPHDYAVSDKVYIIRNGIYRKLEGPHLGPYPVTHIYTNGTVRIQRREVNKQVNNRCLTPHFS